MTWPAQIVDWAQRLQDQLAAPFRPGGVGGAAGSPRLLQLMEVIGAQFQEVEDFAYAIFAARDPSNAVGFQLDRLGRLLGQPRGDLSDDEYRGILRAAGLANVSDTSPATVAQVLAWALQGAIGDTPVRYFPQGQGGYTLYYVTDTPVSDALSYRAQDVVDLASAPGATVRIIEIPETDPFTYDDSGPGFDVGHLARRLGRPTGQWSAAA